MDTVLGIGVIVGLVVVWWGFSRLMNRGTAMVSGAVTGNTRTRGLAAVKLRQQFTLPVEGNCLIDRLVQSLELSPTVKDGLKLGTVPPDRSALEILIGNRMAQPTKFLVRTEPHGAGSTGLATVVAWREVEGRVPATEAVERIHQHVRAAVQALGGEVSEVRSV